MSTMDVQYDEGSKSVFLVDGTLAERGKPVKVDARIGKQLLEQGWKEASKPKKVTNTTTVDTPNKEND